jgi:predicted nuclease of predicted toxin-antitoxin system
MWALARPSKLGSVKRVITWPLYAIATMDDADILAWAVQEQRLVITMDKDFGELVYHSGQAHAGVLLLRLDQANSQEKVQTVAAIFAQQGDQLAGHFSVYQNGNLRIR